MSYGYDNPLTISYNFGVEDFADAAQALAIQRPNGKKFARIEDLHVAVTETFNAVTTSAFLRIGTASDADKFAELDMTTAADTDGYGTVDDTDAIKAAGKEIDMDNDGDSAAAIDQLEVATIANTGGTPAGQGYITIVVSWW